MYRFVHGVLAYLVPTFALGFVWHLVLFQPYYDALAIHRRDIVVPFGFLSMLIQAVVFAWAYSKAFGHLRGSLVSRSLRYGTGGAMLSWSFTTLAVAAKNQMASVPNYLMIETAFTIVQWAMVAPLTAWALRSPDHAVSGARW
jgi:hypothetical protein